MDKKAWECGDRDIIVGIVKYVTVTVVLRKR